MRKIDVPVLIVGGGGAGLSASNFLADLGIESLLIERHSATSHLPKAHYLNQRTMEIFRHHNLADPVYAKGAPRKNMGKAHWCTSLGGDGPLDGIRFVTVDIMGGGSFAAEYDRKGVTAPTNIPQIRLEPILAAIAAERNPGRVLFRHELISFGQDESGVTARVRDLERGEDMSVRARYMIGADAGKTVGPALGIKMIGPTGLADVVGVHFSADLSKYIREDDSVLRMIVHPGEALSEQGTGGLLTYGPTRWDGHSEEWGVSWGYRPGQKVDEDNVEAALKAFLKIDVPVQIHQITRWSIEAVVADAFRRDRVFIVGDAAHKHSPFAGLGLNSGIQDAHNLCWKLALVLKGKAPPSLLDSYERERRPVVQHNAEWSLFAFGTHDILIASAGITRGASEAHNNAQFAQLIADTPVGEARRARMQEVFRITRVEYGVHDLEMGFTYPDGAIVDDGAPFPPRDPLGHVYEPSTRPGCRLPHAWLNVDGQALSTHDLLPVGGFLLIAGEKGSGWCAAADRVAAETGIRMRAVAVGDHGGPADPSGMWTEASGIGEDGAILVRPDGHVGFRSKAGVSNAHEVLDEALSTILAGAGRKMAAASAHADNDSDSDDRLSPGPGASRR